MLQQPNLKHDAERWKDLLIKSTSEILWGDVPYVQPCKVRSCCPLDRLIVEQRTTASIALCLNRKLFEFLVMACKCPDLMGEVDPLSFVPLLRDLCAHSDAFKAFEAEGGEVSKDDKLVYLSEGELHVIFVCHAQVCFDLFLQLLPSSNIICIPWSRHWVPFLFINGVLNVPFLHI